MPTHFSGWQATNGNFHNEAYQIHTWGSNMRYTSMGEEAILGYIRNFVCILANSISKTEG